MFMHYAIKVIKLITGRDVLYTFVTFGKMDFNLLYVLCILITSNFIIEIYASVN